MIRKLLLPALLVGLLAGCVSAGYSYRDGYYYGQPAVEYRYHDYGYGYYPPYRYYAPYRYHYGYPYYGYYGYYGYPYWYSYPNYYHRPHYRPRPPIVHPNPNPNPGPTPRPPRDDDDDRRPPWRDPTGRMRRPGVDPADRVVAQPQPLPPARPTPLPRVEPRRVEGPRMPQPSRRALPRRNDDSGRTEEP